MFFFTKGGFKVLWLLYYVFPRSCAGVAETKEETRPYEFSFNIVDFQHRYEKKDTRGIITGEYGFITADGVYHETGYATDENGDFVITRMRNRKITGLKDALEIFRDRPEAAKKLVEAVAKACGGCKIPIKQEKPNETDRTPSMASSAPTRSQVKLSPVLEHMVETVTKSTNSDDATTKEKFFEGRNEIPDAPKDSSAARRGKSLEEGIVRNKVDSAKKLLRNGGPNSGDVASDGRVPEKMANELHYRFNYTITSHEHQEDGYRSGKKDGSYRAQSENGVDTRVRYLSNEFGHQPNISFVPRANKTNEPHRLKGYSFLWYRS